jgi:hypothetical protein
MLGFSDYIAVAMPLGTPLAVSADVIGCIPEAKLPAKDSAERQRAWKPSAAKAAKGRDNLQIVIKERIRAVLHVHL